MKIKVTSEIPAELWWLLIDLVDPSSCDLDHHGYCQAHNWTLNRPCPQKRAKETLGLI